MFSPKKQRRRPPTPRYASVRNTCTTSKETARSVDTETCASTSTSTSTLAMEPWHNNTPRSMPHCRPRLIQPKSTVVRIAFCGTLCCGKTTLANHLQEHAKQHNIDIRRISFDDEVIKVAKQYFGMIQKDRTLLTRIDNAFRDIDKNVWVNAFKHTIESSGYDHWVVDDVHYENEHDALRTLGFKLIKIDISREEQMQRIQQTYPPDYEDHKNAERHSSEQLVACKENYVFDTVFDASNCQSQLQSWLQQHVMGF